MWQILLTLLWGLVVLASFVSLGRLLVRALDPPLLVDLPLTAGIGMAGMVFIGGILDLAHTASSGVLVALIVALVVVEALVSFRSRRRPAPGGPAATDRNGGLAAAAAIGLFLAVMSFRYFLSLGHPYCEWDDNPFYLAQIVKLLQTGTLGVEPYCFRQMQSLNGQTFLAALGCCAVSLEYAYLVDPGICLVVLGGLVYTFLRRDLRQPIAVAGLLSTMSLLVRTYTPNNNLGGQFSGPVLLVAAARLMFMGNTDSAAFPFGRLVLAALTLSSMAVLKSTLLVYACLFLACWFLLTLGSREPTTIVRQALPLTLFVALFALPWMIQQYLSSGTPLYPALGKGHFFANHGVPVELHGDTFQFRLKFALKCLSSGYFVASLLTLSVLAMIFARSSGEFSRSVLSMSLSGVLGSLLLCFLYPALVAERYMLPTLFVSCLLPGLFGLTIAVQGSRLGLVLGCALVLFVGNQWLDNSLFYARILKLRARGETNPGPAYAENIRHVQSLTEAGKRILVGVHSAFPLDYRRNPIWNFDCLIGVVSPPPGLPLTRNWKELGAFIDCKSQDLPPPGPVGDFRDFLVGSGVDYLLFERGPKAVFYLVTSYADPKISFSSQEQENKMDRMLVSVARLIHKSLLNLAQDRHVLFDDGNMVLLDLRRGASRTIPRSLTWGSAIGVQLFATRKVVLMSP